MLGHQNGVMDGGTDHNNPTYVKIINKNKNK